jgi:hypothetical protein
VAWLAFAFLVLSAPVAGASPEVEIDVEALAEPRLDRGRVMEPVSFRIQVEGDAAAVERFEIELFEAADLELERPIRTISGAAWNSDGIVVWDGNVRPGVALKPGDWLSYVLRVHGEDGSVKETQPKFLILRDPSGELLDPAELAAAILEETSCYEAVCQEGPGYTVEIVSRGDAESRALEAEAASPEAGRRVEVSGDFRLRLPGRGSFWVTEDPAVLEPLLNVGTSSEPEVEGGRLVEPVHFHLYTNYDAFIDRWELLLFRADDRRRERPIQVFTGWGWERGYPIRWDGSLRHGQRLRAGEELEYVLRVYDADGRMDETNPKAMRLRDARSKRPPLDPSLWADAKYGGIARDRLSLYGTTALARQTIPLHGSRVRVHGTDLDHVRELWIDGERVPLSDEGQFAHESILPLGEHMLLIDVESKDDERWHRELPVEVEGRHFFMVGIAELTASRNSFSGAIEPVAGDEDFEEGVSFDGRMAFYLKGKVQGKYLITAHADAEGDEIDEILGEVRREDAFEMFRRLDGDRYYPVYGDDSTTVSDVDTQGRLYVRVDWDKSEAIWGNYDTGITGNEFTAYNRSLYGAKVSHVSTETTKFNDHEHQVIAFASQARTALAHNEFLGTGGSLYFLKHAPIAQGSEKVWIEVRDRISSRVLQNITLERGRDYEMDDLLGRIILNRPLMQIAQIEGVSVIKSTPLDGNDLVLVVDYEYIPDDFDTEKATYGFRGKKWANDYVAGGASFVHESRADEDYQLRGVDVTLRAGKGSYLKAEYAESEASQTSVALYSEDGGLSFRSTSASNQERDRNGDAINLEGHLDLDEVTAGFFDAEAVTWWKRRDAQFSTARADTGTDTTEYGGELAWQAAPRLALAARGAVIDQQDVRIERTLSLQADYPFADRWQLSGELRHMLEELEVGERREETLGGVRLGFDVTDDVNVYTTGQASLSRDGGEYDNDLVSLGVSARLRDRWTVRAEGSTGRFGKSLLLGTDLSVNDHYDVYISHTLASDRAEGQRAVTTFGQRARLSNQLTMFSENQFTHGERQNGLSQLYGLEITPTTRWTFGFTLQRSDLEESALGEVKRQAVSLSAAYNEGRSRWQGKLEFRRDRGDADRVQLLVANQLDFKLTDSIALSGKLDGSTTRDRDADRDLAVFVESGVGFAYRPVRHDRLNVIGKYTFLYDLPNESQGLFRTDERAHVISLEALYDLTKSWTVGSAIKTKLAENRVDRNSGSWLKTQTSFAALRASYHFLHAWDAQVEHRWLMVHEAESLDQGFLAAIYRHVGANLKVGVGYNFTDFNDDLTNLGYDNRGTFLTVIGKY